MRKILRILSAVLTAELKYLRAMAHFGPPLTQRHCNWHEQQWDPHVVTASRDRLSNHHRSVLEYLSCGFSVDGPFFRPARCPSLLPPHLVSAR